jgi:hypothetical protein
MTSLDFSYKALVILPLISLTNLDLKMRMPPYLTGSYYSKLNTFLLIRLSISYLSDALNGAPGVVILPCLRNFRESSWSARFLSVIKDIEKLALSFSVWRILFFDPLSRSRPYLVDWCITTIGCFITGYSFASIGSSLLSSGDFMLLISSFSS